MDRREPGEARQGMAWQGKQGPLDASLGGCGMGPPNTEATAVAISVCGVCLPACLPCCPLSMLAASEGEVPRWQVHLLVGTCTCTCLCATAHDLCPLKEGKNGMDGWEADLAHA